MKVLILGASYGSLLSTKLLMAGHDVTLICRSASAALINSVGTEVRSSYVTKMRTALFARLICRVH